VSLTLKQYFGPRVSSIEAALDRFVPSATDAPQRLHEAMRYSVFASGKRLRPILVIAGAEAVGATADLVMPTACAVECLHTFSLIHDDLPCMDNSDFRRGKPANHKVYGEALALLAGDALLALAFQLIAENAACVPYERALQVLRMVTRVSSSHGMAAGQLADMESQGQQISYEALHDIHANKTGGLLTACVISGAILAGASPEPIEALRVYGDHVGMAFQIADDILNVIGNQETMGKPVGNDAESDKATFPRLYGLAESRQRAHAEVEAAIMALQEFDGAADPLRAIASYIVERDL
jgi:geranylgeranyl diphosphate synthase type II